MRERPSATMHRRRLLGVVLVFALAASACQGDGGRDSGGTTDELVAQVASYELIVGEENRFLLGLLTQDNLFVTAGRVDLRFSFLEQGDPEQVMETTAEFLPIPGEEPEHEHTEAHPPSEGRGVYVARGIEFDRPGFWQVEAIAHFGEGDVRTGTAAFEVVDAPRVPGVGEKAPLTENLTLDSSGPKEAIDSRAGTKGKIPDPELHETTIADAIQDARPALVVFSTPVFCLSQFCGPVTDMIGELAADYGDRAAFIHVEIWRDHQKGVINEAAAEWLFRDDNLNEPWVFLIGPDGRIAARWDNVATREEIEPLLRKFPRSA